MRKSVYALVVIFLGILSSSANAAGTLTTIGTFAFSDGALPQSDLVLGADGLLYGTTKSGGAGYGTVFKVERNGSGITSLYSFPAGAGNGVAPYAGLHVAPDGDFYGTTTAGGAVVNGVFYSAGTVFRISPAGALTTLASFTTNGAAPWAGVIRGSDGNFYGTTRTGGTHSRGTVFRMTPEGEITTLGSFTELNGAFPQGSLVEGAAGVFYGMTYAGGTSNLGTIYQVTAAGGISTLVSLAGHNGAGPNAALVFGGDGNLYGTTAYGGSTYIADQFLGFGTVFRISTSGNLTTLASFDGSTNGALPTGTLLKGRDGVFYGTTSGAGSMAHGSVFSLTPAGQLTNLVTFTGGPQMGGTPLAGVVEDDAGDLYGTTSLGGANGHGTVFRLVIDRPPLVTLLVSPGSIVQGQSATLSWSADIAASCTASGSWSGAKASSGTEAVSPGTVGTHNYGLTCTAPGGTTSKSVALEVLSANTPAAPTVTISVSPTSVVAGVNATLAWSTTDATQCTASGAWSGSRLVAGSAQVSHTGAGTFTYTLSCSGAGGTTLASTTLSVTAADVDSGGGGPVDRWLLLGLFLLLWATERRRLSLQEGCAPTPS